jgi:hypothetical protein
VPPPGARRAETGYRASCCIPWTPIDPRPVGEMHDEAPNTALRGCDAKPEPHWCVCEAEHPLARLIGCRRKPVVRARVARERPLVELTPCPGVGTDQGERNSRSANQRGRGGTPN